MPNQRATPLRKVGLDDELWAELGNYAGQLGRDRSAIIRELATAWVRRQRKHAADQAAAAAAPAGQRSNAADL